MEKLLKDSNTMVLGSAVAAFTEVCARCVTGDDYCAECFVPVFALSTRAPAAAET